ncbi:MAG: TonB-dependent receptor [Candidatus Marinimicrobia bacterium]|nr:TonB-dependent receptor [Candidatus Neomarinimicrobiota bacterium]
MNRIKMTGFSVLLFLLSVTFAQESDFDEWLELDLTELMNIKVTTATKTDQLIEKVPATVRIITANQIKDRGYNSLEDVLQDLPGFQIRNIQGFNTYSFQRGAPSQNNLILVLIDGIQVNELNSGGFYGGYLYNLQNVKQIEVVYGPSSALYGTNAISGIINIITKDADDQPKADANITAGSFGTFFIDGSYRINPENSQMTATIAAHYKQTDKADLGGENGDWNWSENMENFEKDFGIDSKINYKNTKIGCTLQDRQSSMTTQDKSVGTDYLDTGTNYHIRFIDAYLSNLYDKGNDWSLKSQLYYRNATVLDNTIAYIRADSAHEIGQVGWYRPNSQIGLEEQFDYEINKSVNLVTGIVVETENLADGFSATYSGDPEKEPAKPGAPDFDNNTLASFYTQIQYKFFNFYEITAGSRLDHSSYYGTVFTPRLGVVYNRKIHTVKLLYTEAFRAPKPWDYNWEDGNPDLEPEFMKAIEFANILTPTKYLRIDLSVYINQINNILTKNDSATQWINADKMNTNGLEANLEYSRGKMQFFINYTFNDSKYSDGKIVPEIAQHGFNTGVGYSMLQNLKLHLRGNYLGRRKNPVHITTTDSDYVDAYFVLNGVISYKPTPKVDIQMAVNNLLDARYYHTSNRPPERYRQAQRAFLIKLGYQI